MPKKISFELALLSIQNHEIEKLQVLMERLRHAAGVAADEFEYAPALEDAIQLLLSEKLVHCTGPRTYRFDWQELASRKAVLRQTVSNHEGNAKVSLAS